MVCLDTAYYWKYSNKINFKCINSVVRPSFKAKFTFGSRKQYTRPRKKYQMPNVAADVQSKLSFISLSDCVSFPFINHSKKTWWMRLNVPTWKKKKKKMMTRERLVELWWFWQHLFDGNMLRGSYVGALLILDFIHNK